MGNDKEEGRPPRWELESSEPLHDYSMFSTRRDRVRSPKDGSLHDFYVAESADGVTVVALTPEKKLVMVEQFRHPHRERMLETPSGVIDEGESAEDAGVRELREETGYAGNEPERLGTLLLNPSWQTTRVHVLLVRNARRVASKDLDEMEDVRVREVPLAEVISMIIEGALPAGVVVSALALYQWRVEGTRPGTNNDRW